MPFSSRRSNTSTPPTADASASAALQELGRLTQVVSRTSVPPDAGATELEGVDGLLRSCTRQAFDTVLRVGAEHRAVPVTQACQVAHLGLREAERALGARARAIDPEALRTARLKLFLALLTLRHTLARVQNECIPLWRMLSPALAARRALAGFRDALATQIEQGDEDIPWRLFVAQGELGLLLVHPSLSTLSDASRDGLACFAGALRDVRDAGTEARRRFAHGARVIDGALAELSRLPELRGNDEHVLRGFLSLLSRQRGGRAVCETAKSLLFAVRGLDPELDRMATELDSGTLTWSHLATRAAELVAERFAEAPESLPIPRLLR